MTKLVRNPIDAFVLRRLEAADMLTDRCCTMALLATLCTFYPGWAFCFQLSMVIDVSCHWIHLHASLMRVSEGTLKILFKGCCLQMLNCIESISFIG